ncbi:hypothetical protein CS542_07850 [Pedobacter sp. IW39]|nr:hypothetical protein CS542_07850 [Pedobacter sp. IW39]
MLQLANSRGGTPATAGLITYRSRATGDCKLAALPDNVKPDVTIAVTSAVKTDARLCVNTAITQIEYQVTNGGYDYRFTSSNSAYDACW